MGTDEKKGEQDVCLDLCGMNVRRGEVTTGAQSWSGGSAIMGMWACWFQPQRRPS